jgi:membrane protein DedA with SNARE-associated domain
MAFLPQLPTGIETWPPFWQAGALFVSTFVLEDVAAVGAGWLLATGSLGWPWALGSCFLGIWSGDVGLYGLARVLGRAWFERTSLQRFANRIEQSERWFSQRSDWILILSRLMPGARLPTYLAAGFLRLPLNRFLFMTGIASLVWTLMILLAARTLGSGLLAWLGPLRRTGWAVLLVVPILWILLHFARKVAQPGAMQRLAVWLQRWRHWEFWPAWMFYPPVALYCLWLAIKHHGLFLPTVANPGIFSGGIVGESKMATLQALMDTSPEFTADAELLSGTTPEERRRSLEEIRRRRDIAYPFILKPDVGQRGAGVKLIRSEGQARAVLKQTSAPLIVQRFAPGPCEAGIFYYRFPHQQQGHIFAITEKIFPAITGDGHSTIAQLVWKDPRARFMAKRYLSRLAGRQSEILATGEWLKLVEAGNHAQGCIFQDGMHLHSPALRERIDAISRKIPGFFIGRYDVRYGTESELRSGGKFQIIELNGAASEATSVYDARNSVFTAYRTLFRQWDLVFSIGAANRQRGSKPTPLSLLWRKWREFSKHASSYPVAD